jgi:uncharacterized RDD family membrane protein YckC
MSEVEPGAGTSRHVGDAVPGAGTSPYVGDGVPRRLDAVPHRVDAVPVEARAFQGQRAGIVTRTAANTVDFVLVVAVLAGGYAAWSAVKFLVNPTQFSFPAPSWLFVLVCLEIVLFVYFTASWATTGRTFGDHQLGLRVVNFRGERLRWPGAVIRAAFCCILPMGLYWAAVSPTNRSVQDSVLRTSVVYDWTIRRRTTGGSPARGEPSRPPGPA